ncbi:MAG: CYTH and CHAD domain-containing protein [Colwelliaceae bacterium]|jgi:triphosphatase|nr:CYTH and CHAD domain-containing protein [Colwelliaceae bacterium]
MSTEVELKFLTLSEDVSIKVFNLLKAKELAFTHQIKHLSNCYYDTAELALRHLDMGLRIRICDGHIEQTIKTAGVVIGGLHQRPEYNVDLDTSFPQLTLFPQDVWSNDLNIEKLQTQLIPLFNTDFTREIWLVSIEGAEIELAFDRGEISSDGRSFDICELELELVSGDKDALFSLAQLLSHDLSLRPGMQSKAARGYRLYFKKEEIEDSDVLLEINNDSKNIKSCFVEGISSCLQQMQMSIEQYLHFQTFKKLDAFVDVLALLRQGFWLFEDNLTENSLKIRNELSFFIQLFAWVDNAIYLQELMTKTGNYRKKLDYSKQLIEQLRLEKRRFPDKEMIAELLHSERFNLLQLSLLKLITSNKNEHYFIDSNEEAIVPFAKKKLSQSLASLTHAMSSFSSSDAEQWLAQRKILHRSLLTGHWFGGFFDDNKRIDFRLPWQDMQIGLRELQSLWIIKQQLEKVELVNESSNKKVVDWQESKVENLLLALAHCKDSAISLPAYWLE